jgi:hypothetical protein
MRPSLTSWRKRYKELRRCQRTNQKARADCYSFYFPLPRYDRINFLKSQPGKDRSNQTEAFFRGGVSVRASAGRGRRRQGGTCLEGYALTVRLVLSTAVRSARPTAVNRGSPHNSVRELA